VALSLIIFQLQNNVWLMVKKYFILKYFAVGLEVQKWCALCPPLMAALNVKKKDSSAITS